MAQVVPGEVQIEGYQEKFLFWKSSEALEEAAPEVMESQFLEVLKKHVDVVLRDQWAALVVGGQLDWMILVDSIIL